MITQKVNYLELIKSARDAQLSRDLETEAEILKTVWNDFDSDPDFENLEPILLAQMFCLCGYFLSNFGRAKHISNFQMRGKDLLSKGIRIFEGLGIYDKLAEAKCHLALCYWREGATEEAEIVLIDAEERFAGNELHPIHLEIQINRLIIHYWNNDYQSALKIIDKIKIPMEFCPDERLQTMFHNQTALAYWCVEDYEKAIIHYKEAERFARFTNNIRSVAKVANNIANTYRMMGELEQSNVYVERAIKIFSDLGDEGWIANVLDTKALIRMAESKYEEALELIDISLRTQSQSDDAVSFIESLWTKCEILMRLDRKAEGLQVYAELAQQSSTRIGQTAFARYTKQFADLIYFKKERSLSSNVSDYKKSLIRQGLVNNNGKIKETASELKISHQSLSEMLRHQFPELRAEFNLDVRSPRGRKKFSPISAASKKSVKHPAKSNLKRITAVNLGDAVFQFENSRRLDQAKLLTFIVSKDLMRRFGIKDDAMVCIFKGVCAPGAAGMIYRKDEKEFDCGIFGVDKFSGFVYLDGDEPAPMLPEEIYSVGEIIGYCLLDEINETEILFKKIRL